MAAIGQGVTLRGLRSEDFTYTWNLSGTAGVSPGIGSPMMQDTTVDNTAKGVVDNGILIGALMSYENRIQEGITVGAIAHKGVFVWDYTGSAPVRGNSVVGSATANKVKDSGATAPGNRVVAVDTVAVQVTVKYD